MIFNEKDFYKKIRIDLDEFFNGEKVFIVVNEPKLEQYFELKDAMQGFQNIKEGEDNTEAVKSLVLVLSKLFPDLIIEHNFYKNEKEKLSSSEIINYLFSKLDIVTKVSEKYLDFFLDINK